MRFDLCSPSSSRGAALTSALAVGSLMALSGCGAPNARAIRSASATIADPVLPPRPAFDFKRAAPKSVCDLDPRACPKNGEGGRFALQSADVYAVSASSAASKLSKLLAGAPPKMASTVALPQSAAAAAAGPRAPGRRVELEAQFALRVTNVEASANAVRKLAEEHQAAISKDERASDSGSRAELLVRVPSERYDAFAAGLERVGQIVRRNVKEADVELEERDLALIATNLEAALARYRELLTKATSVTDTLAAEREIERVSMDLERVKTRLAWMRDRISRATVAIALQSQSADHREGDPWDPPTFALGMRGIAMFDAGASGSDAYLGGGLTVRFPSAGGDSRGLAIDVDALHACCGSTPARSDLGYAISGGWDMYPEKFSGHSRPWLVPYLGARAGYANLRDRGDFAAAGIIGLDVLRTANVLLDLNARIWIMAGNDVGPHAAVQPNLGVHVGF